MPKKKRTIEGFITPRPRIHCGRFSVTAKTTHDVDGSPAGHSTAVGDSVTQLYADDKYKLADALEALAREVRNTSNDFDGGSASVFVLRRYSSAAHARFKG